MHPGQLLTAPRFRAMFATQFLGALNDNLFKNALLVLLTFHVVTPGLDTAVVGGSQALVEEARAGRIDQVYVTLPIGEERNIKKLLSEIADTGVSKSATSEVQTTWALPAS